MTEEIMLGIILEIKKFRNELPSIYSLVEKEYIELNDDVEVNPRKHIIIDNLTSYHAVRFMKLLDEYTLDEREKFDD